MPWQTAPGLLIIIGCFTCIGCSIPVLHKLMKGKPRLTGQDDFDYMLGQRDERLAAAAKNK